jgi:hypothetical protein
MLAGQGGRRVMKPDPKNQHDVPRRQRGRVEGTPPKELAYV